MGTALYAVVLMADVMCRSDAAVRTVGDRPFVVSWTRLGDHVEVFTDVCLSVGTVGAPIVMPAAVR